MDNLSLSAIALRTLTLHLYKCTMRWRKQRDVLRDLQRLVRNLQASLFIRKQIHAAVHDIAYEIKRWDEKHAKMFVEEEIVRSKRSRCKRSRADHLLIFHDALVWNSTSLTIDDYQTAQRLIHVTCHNWPQMRFQFACCYAITDLLQNSNVFDHIRRRVFKKTLSSHCVYDLWLCILEAPKRRSYFDENSLLADQKCVQTIHFAFTNGYFELGKHFWDQLSPMQQESVGFLCWKSVCYRSNSGPIIKFLCNKLCQLNSKGLTSLSWDSFYFKVCESLEKDYNDNPTEYMENLKKLEVLLNNWCPKLRHSLLVRHEFKAIINAYYYTNEETFRLLLTHVDEKFLSDARKLIETIYAKKQTTERCQLKDALLRRQLTYQQHSE
ncbi:hypothetical protein M3Y94_00267900 [Aphelenchoides besseyi]|nr:hypothetical protein M3Y94_00267900 [Aphelenchoides besseyi]KAI6236112.1 hypothetical protein M3Y95_00123100 [Aphelenchoides besseyi]